MLNFGPATSFGFGANGSGGGGGSLTGANDGLSVSGSTVQLGQTIDAVGDPAQLLEPREIPFNGQSLSFIERASGNNITFDPTDINFITNATDWSGGGGALSFTNLGNNLFGLNVFNEPAFGGDVGNLFFEAGSNISHLFFLSSGNVLLGNQAFIPTTDSQDLFQIYGSAHIDISASNSQTGAALSIIPFTDAGGNFNEVNVTSTGYLNLNAQYNGSNGGNFQGTFNLTQAINYNNGGQSQQAINTNININWDNDTLGTIAVIAFNEVQLQMNLNAAGDSNPAQISLSSSGSTYGAGWWVYRGMNPLGSDGTGALNVISGGDQTGVTRVTPLASFAARTDFNNGGQVNVTGTMASYHSDLSIGAPGSLDAFVDYSAGGGFNNQSGAFTVGLRIAFWAQDMTASQSTGLAYAFKSEGPGDISWLAGKLQVGGEDLGGGYTGHALIYAMQSSLFSSAQIDTTTVVDNPSDTGKLLTDQGSTTGTTYTLSVPGIDGNAHFYFAVVSAGVTISLSAGVSVNFGGNVYTTSLISNAVGSFIHLVQSAANSGLFFVASSTGSWSGV